MNWVSLWSLAERQQWAEAHPWVAGFSFGLVMAIFFGVYVAIPARVGVGVVVGVALWLVCWPLFALGVKRRWWQRPDAENDDLASTIRRPWRRASDRMLSWYIWGFAFSALVSIFGLIAGSGTVSALFTLAVSVLMVATAWAERRRRRMSQ